VNETERRVYRFPASSISAVAGRNRHRNWRDAALDVYVRCNNTATESQK